MRRLCNVGSIDKLQICTVPLDHSGQGSFLKTKRTLENVACYIPLHLHRGWVEEVEATIRRPELLLR